MGGRARAGFGSRPDGYRWAGLVAVVGASCWLWWTTSGTSDVGWWLDWIDHVMARGPLAGYVEIHADYPPGTSLALWIVGQLAATVGSDPRLVLKFVLLGVLMGTTGMLLAASRRVGLSTIAYAALVLNAFGLIYVDIFAAPFVLGAIWAARTGRVPLMAGLLAGACVMKWPPLFVMPFAAVYVFRLRATMDRSFWRSKAIAAAAIPVGLAVLAILVYGFPPLLDAFYRASRHNSLSNYGANPLWILTWWFEWTALPGKQSLSGEGLVSIMAASRPILRTLSLVTLIGYGAILRKYGKSGDRGVEGLLRFSLAGYLVYFLCSAGVHENHLFLASLLGIALAWQQPRWLWVALVLAAAANLNLLAFYGWRGDDALRLVRGVDVSVCLAAAISLALAVVVVRLIRSDAAEPTP